jgi:hypothetical protein
MENSTHEPNDISNFWRLVDKLNIVQAALLVIGLDPALYQDEIEEQGYSTANKPKGYEAAKMAISEALRNKNIKGTNIGLPVCDEYGNDAGLTPTKTNAIESTVERDSLTEWLASRGIRTGFFFPEKQETGTPDYLDPNHPRYAPKLAAAVSAWLANPEIRGKTKKQAIDKWAREHAAQFGLTNDDGLPIEKAMEEIAIVANWNTGGGAPKTPTA